MMNDKPPDYDTLTVHSYHNAAPELTLVMPVTDHVVVLQHHSEVSFMRVDVVGVGLTKSGDWTPLFSSGTSTTCLHTGVEYGSRCIGMYHKACVPSESELVRLAACNKDFDEEDRWLFREALEKAVKATADPEETVTDDV